VNIFRQIALGNHLARMTSWMERIEAERRLLPIGTDGADGLSLSDQARCQRDLHTGMAALAKYPRHLVTEAIIKNQRIALSLGRHERAEAQHQLLGNLIHKGLALSLEDFSKSYA
jgi:hypothetical protein